MKHCIVQKNTLWISFQSIENTAWVGECQAKLCSRSCLRTHGKAAPCLGKEIILPEKSPFLSFWWVQCLAFLFAMKGKKGKQKVNCNLSSCKIVSAPTKLSKLKKAELFLLMPFVQDCCPAMLTEMEVVALLPKLVTLLILNEAFYWINHCSIKYCWAIIYIHPLHPEWFCRFWCDFDLPNTALHY